MTIVNTNGVPTHTGISINVNDVLNNDYNAISNGITSSGLYARTVEVSVEEQRRRDEYRRDAELLEAEHRERMEALKTIFPRGYAPDDCFDLALDLAGEDQLNPLYETVLKEFEDAQTALHRAARKLLTAVKMTDSDELAERKGKRQSKHLEAAINGLGRQNGFAYQNGSNWATLGGQSTVQTTAYPLSTWGANPTATSANLTSDSVGYLPGSVEEKSQAWYKRWLGLYK